MAKNNSKLFDAKRNKHDEYFTRYQDVEREMGCYLKTDKNLFRDKTIYLPSDVPGVSAFHRYFVEHRLTLGWKCLISTSYKTLIDTDTGQTRGFCEIFQQNPEDGSNQWKRFVMDGDGDFASSECAQYFAACDFVVTNPPFSLFIKFFSLVQEYKKRFILLSPYLSPSYKRVFQKIFRGETWFGSAAVNWFVKYTYQDGEVVEESVNVACLWLTNIYHESPLKKKELESFAQYTMVENLARCPSAKREFLYKKYNRTDIIECSRLEYLPTDFIGKIGLPITALLYLIHPRKPHEVGVYDPSTADSYGMVNELALTKTINNGRVRYGAIIGTKEHFTRIILQLDKSARGGREMRLCGELINGSPIRC